MSFNNFVVETLVVGNSGVYQDLNVRGYNSIRDQDILTDAISRSTMDGSAVSKLGEVAGMQDGILQTSDVAGASIAIEGSLSERRNVWHMVISDHGVGDGVSSRYIVTGYVAPNSVVDGVILPNAEFYINNIMRYHNGPNGWIVRSNILTNTTENHSMAPSNPINDTSRHRVRLFDTTKAAGRFSLYNQITDRPHITHQFNRTTEFIDQRENQAGDYLQRMGNTYQDVAQGYDHTTTTEILDQAAKKLLVGDGELIVNYFVTEAYMENGSVSWEDMARAFNLGNHNTQIINDGSMATLNNYSNPNSATIEGRVAYTIANNFGNACLGAGVIVAVCTFTNNAHYDPRYGANFSWTFDENESRCAMSGMDQQAAVDKLMSQIAERILPHISNGGAKTTVRVSFAAFKDIIIEVDCGSGIETFVYPAFSSSSYTLTIAGTRDGAATMNRLAFAVNSVVGTRTNIDNQPIGMSDINTPSAFGPTVLADNNAGNNVMPQPSKNKFKLI